MILVSSAKGGVGKSSVTINLAFALRRLNMNNRVGILDADVFGPSIPRMLNLEDRKADVDKRKYIKIARHHRAGRSKRAPSFLIGNSPTEIVSSFVQRICSYHWSTTASAACRWDF